MRKVNIKVRQKSSCSYEASVYIDGKRLYRSARTEKEAKFRIKQAIQDAEKGKTIFRTGKLCDAMEYYLENVKYFKVKATTYDRAESTFKYHIKSEKIGKMQIGQITSEDIQSHLVSQCNLGLSFSSIKKIYNLLGEFFRYETTIGNIARNPMQLVEMPHMSNLEYEEKDMEVLSTEDMRKVIGIAEHRNKCGKSDYRYGEALVLLMVTGMRSGELRGLNINDISLEHRYIHVHRNVVYAKDRKNGGIKYIIGDVKTKKSDRIIPLNDRAVLAIQRLIDTTLNPNTGYLLCTSNGKIVTHSQLCKCYSAILKKAGIEHMGLHSTRHSFATAVLKDAEDKGQIKEVSELLGHSQVSTTYEYYIKASDEDKRVLINQLGKLVS